MISYSEIRDWVSKNHTAFHIAHILFTPVRMVKEFIIKDQMAKVLIRQYSFVKREEDKIFYFGIPEHNNLGDLAQTYCTRLWLSENFPRYKILEANTRTVMSKRFLAYLKSMVNDNDYIIFQSGYCTQDGHMDHQMHKTIVNIFADYKIVFLPQTVNIKSKRETLSSKKIYRQCGKLLFLSRDKISYNRAKKILDETKIRCYPDIVTYLIGKESDNHGKREGVLLCVRNDSEKFYSEEEISKLQKRLETKYKTVEVADTNADIDVSQIYLRLGESIRKKIDEFRRFQVVITDRYHGTIFSLIANTPVIVLKTNDHKVSSGVDWFKGIFERDAVKLADDLDMAWNMACEICDRNIIVENSSWFYDQFYREKLRDEMLRL